MKNRKKILLIAEAGVFTALLLAYQYFTSGFGQIVTGAGVNLILILAVLTGNFWVGLGVASVSPWFAYMLGIGPVFIQIVPFVMLGNIALVAVWALIIGRTEKTGTMLYIRSAIAAVIAAGVKFGVLYLGVVKIALTLIKDIKPPQVDKMTAMFTFPQLFTALIGGAVAVIVYPTIKTLKK